MAKKVLTLIKLQIPGGQANPAPPVGPALGQHGVNIMEFCKAFNAQTAQQNGRITPVEITVYEDRSFDFITKTPPAAVLIKEALRLEKGSGEPNREKVGRLTRDQVRQIAETKMPDLNARDVEQAMKVVAGTARSMGVEVDCDPAREERTAARPRADRPRAALLAGRGDPPAEELPEKKFDETVEVHFSLGLNVRHAEQQLRGTLMLPHGTGRESRVAVFAEGDKAREAQEAGADVVGTADLAKQIEEGFDDFDVAIATPDQMGVVGKLGRILGPRGKMPNPKTGTVTMDVGKAVQRSEGRQAGVPHRPRRERPRRPRQEELRRAAAARELRGADRRDHAREAVGGQGPLHQRRYTRRLRWAPASTSIRRGRGESSKSSRRHRQQKPYPPRPARRPRQSAARERRSPAEAANRGTHSLGPAFARACHFRGGDSMLKTGQGTDRRGAGRSAAARPTR